MGLDGRLAGPRAHHGTLDAEPVADAEVVEHLVCLGHDVLAQQDLKPAAAVLKVDERGAAHAPQAYHAPGYGDAVGADAVTSACLRRLEVRDGLG